MDSQGEQATRGLGAAMLTASDPLSPSDMTSPTDEVALVPPRPPATPDRRPQLGWTAPGSLAADDAFAAYLRGGLNAMGRVPGPWGLAIIDPARDSVLLATDPIGIQPVFWARTADGHVAVSARIAALADRPDVPDSLDHEGILLAAPVNLAGEAGLHRTHFRAISRIPMGRAVEFTPDGACRHHRYYDPAQIQVDESFSLDDCTELLAERIDAAVRRNTGSRAVYGAHVSGGLDCTAVACRAHQVLKESGEGLRFGYSWAPAETEVPRFPGDERDLLDDVSRVEGLPIRRTAQGPHGHWHDALDPNRFPYSTHGRERFLLPRMRQDGVEVVLSGWGGDELASFNGRKILPHLFRRGQWRELARISTTGMTTGGRYRRARRAARTLAHTAFNQLPDPISGLRHPIDHLAETRLNREIDAELRAAWPAVADLRRDGLRRLNSCTDPHEFQLLLLTAGHIQHRTGGWFQTGELFGIRYRYPLLDLGVVEAALSLPWFAYLSRGWQRIAYRRAVAPWVPDTVAWNLRKVEPALYFPPTGPAQLPEQPAATPFVPDDPRYADTMALIRLCHQKATNRGRVNPDLRVRARPEAAV